MNKKNNSSEEKYKQAVKIADTISKEMSWIHANNEILKSSGDKIISEKFIGTYAGHAWRLLRHTILNEIHISMHRIIDKNPNVSSLPNLKLLLDKKVLVHVKKNYTQGKDAYSPRLSMFQARLNRLLIQLDKKDSKFKSLIIHRHTRLAHSAQQPYTGDNKIKWGDETKLIKTFEDIVSPMEHLFLNAGNISGSKKSSYKMYADDLWSSFCPKKE